MAPSDGFEPPTPWSEVRVYALMVSYGLGRLLALMRDFRHLTSRLCRLVSFKDGGVAHAVAHVAHGRAVQCRMVELVYERPAPL